ncbi:hypothetical protein TNCV_1452451 [Trichonephila clavipes]|nr:hypothetical protein TNCV_1452451 [Trichonephila clavipes]
MFQCIRVANRGPTHQVFSANDNQDYHPTIGVFQSTSDASETATLTMPPCHILPTNQDSPNHKSPPTSGQIQIIRFEMEERFAFHFPVTSSVQEGHYMPVTKCYAVRPGQISR